MRKERHMESTHNQGRSELILIHWGMVAEEMVLRPLLGALKKVATDMSRVSESFSENIEEAESRFNTRKPVSWLFDPQL